MAAGCADEEPIVVVTRTELVLMRRCERYFVIEL